MACENHKHHNNEFLHPTITEPKPENVAIKKIPN